MSTRILLIDDDPALLQGLGQTLRFRLENVQVDPCESAGDALARLNGTDYDAIISDIKMPGMDGLRLMERVQALRPSIPILLITGHGDRDLGVQALNAGAYAFIQKPIDREYFLAWLRRALHERSLSRELEEKNRLLKNQARHLERLVQERTGKLHETSEMLKAVMEASPVAIIATDPKGRILVWNRAAERMLGWLRDEVLGRELPRIVEGREQLSTHQLLLGAGEKLADYRTVWRTKDGASIEVTAAAGYWHDSTEEVAGIMVVLTSADSGRYPSCALPGTPQASAKEEGSKVEQPFPRTAVSPQRHVRPTDIGFLSATETP